MTFNNITVITTLFSEKYSNIISFNFLKLLANQPFEKTELAIILLIQILLYCSAKNIIIADCQLSNDDFLKYKISNCLKNNTIKRNLKTMEEYIKYFSEKYGAKIEKKEDIK